jgi:hypothetical protein
MTKLFKRFLRWLAKEPPLPPPDDPRYRNQQALAAWRERYNKMKVRGYYEGSTDNRGRG